jgi:hypothetical protein
VPTYKKSNQRVGEGGAAKSERPASKRAARPNKTVDDRRHGFYSSKTAEQIAEEQGVKPIKDLSQLAGIFPADEVDDFIEWVRANRT